MIWLYDHPSPSPPPTSPVSKLDRQHTGRPRKRDNLLTGEGPDPTFHFDADPDPSFQINVLNAQIVSYCIYFYLSSANWCGSRSSFPLWWGSGSGSNLSFWCGSGSTFNLMWIQIHNIAEYQRNDVYCSTYWVWAERTLAHTDLISFLSIKFIWLRT